ncbi:MAG: oxygen-independent coproporphyrinogen III oxidase [Candidatus Melainabacteria bacterium]|nr:oxygen-independent coproporphyrinogen III oxidase [Candidatus Melainabacteria bacterium]
MQRADTNFKELLRKYGGAIPRYTSYPTAPEWKTPYTRTAFETAIEASNIGNNNYSLYLHLPFCESQCYYCACNIIISKKHEISKSYIKRIKEEIEYIGEKISPERKVIQMAWGGGTPTFLHPDELEEIYEHLAKYFNLLDKADEPFFNHEYSIEIDPRVTSNEHLKTLSRLGFNRLSMGVQDFNEKTQEAINRIQTYESVENMLNIARDNNFSSVNFDLIYGLPHQNLETFKKTIEQVIKLSPERIALFNYAHIPDFFPFQKKYIEEETLPDQKTKLEIFEFAMRSFIAEGYEFIGLDHFARPEDELSKAHKNKKLYRNFQGYTTHDGCDLFGIGLTAISSVQGTYKQNKKKLSEYYNDEEPFAAEKFFISDMQDIERKEIIKEIMCHFYTELDYEKYKEEYYLLESFTQDGLIELNNVVPNENHLDSNKKFSITVTELGRLFVRNIASVFDYYLKQKNAHKLFSKSL